MVPVVTSPLTIWMMQTTTETPTMRRTNAILNVVSPIVSSTQVMFFRQKIRTMQR
jgi:hypothetical protein